MNRLPMGSTAAQSMFGSGCMSCRPHSAFNRARMCLCQTKAAEAALPMQKGALSVLCQASRNRKHAGSQKSGRHCPHGMLRSELPEEAHSDNWAHPQLSHPVLRVH